MCLCVSLFYVSGSRAPRILDTRLGWVVCGHAPPIYTLHPSDKELLGPQSRSSSDDAEKHSLLWRKPHPSRPACNLVTILTEVPRLSLTLLPSKFATYPDKSKKCIYNQWSVIFSLYLKRHVSSAGNAAAPQADELSRSAVLIDGVTFGITTEWRRVDILEICLRVPTCSAI
jgi:hypothetical protein